MPKIISTMTALGYPTNDKGVCFGIAAMATQSIVREKPDSFCERIKKIHNLTDENLKTINANERNELLCFFDGVSVYQGSSRLNGEFKNQNIENKILFKNKLETKQEQKDFAIPDIKKRMICSFTINEFEDFIKELKNNLDTQPFSLMITYPSLQHVTQLGHANNRWLSVDHDNVFIYDNHKKSIQDAIKNIHPKKNLTEQDRFNMSVDILIEEESNPALPDLNNYEISKETIVSLKKNKKDLIEIIFCYVYANKYNALHSLFAYIDHSDIFDLLHTKNIAGISALLWAVLANHINTVDTIIEIIQTAKVADTKKALLLEAKSNSGTPALCAATQKERLEIVESLIKAIKNSRLTSEQKTSLLIAKRVDGKPALYLAAEEGHVTITNAFIFAITSQDNEFSSEQRASMLEAKDGDNTAALYIAAQKGHLDTVVAFIEAIKNAELSKEQKVMLLKAEEINGASAMHIAAQNGHADIVKAFTKTIEKSGLSVTDQAVLLEAKNNNGITALFIATYMNHTDVINILCEAVNNSALSDRVKASILQAQDKHANSALFIAIHRNDTNTIKALTQAILNSGLPDAEKATMLEAKKEVSSLLIAVKNGNLDVTKHLLEEMLLLNIPTEEKIRLLRAEIQQPLTTLYKYAKSLKKTEILNYLENQIFNSTIFNEEQKARILN